MAKYIIDIASPNVRNEYIVYWTYDGLEAKRVSDLTPYTEPDLEQVRKEAYKKGLSDAWDAARKIGSELRYGLEIMGFSFEPRAVGYDPGWYVVQRHSASECIAKIRRYELFRDGRIP